MTAAATLRRTPLYEAHLAAGARMAPFAGYEMPVSYQGISAEHLAVREAAGVFDVSHMGQIEVEGAQALDLLQRLLSNDASTLEPGAAQYSCLCREDGGVLDDLFTYRLGADRYLTVTNAANHPADLDWFRDHAAGLEVEVHDVADRYAMLAVQGPRARELVAPLIEGELPVRMRVGSASFAGAPCIVCGTGYTGEDGVEVLIGPGASIGFWDALVDAGVKPAGLGARDTLRLEVCFHLHGNDLTVERNPIEAGLGWCCAEQTGFIGSDAVARARADGTLERLAPFEIVGRGIPRRGNPAIKAGDRVGEVTSGTHSPSLGVGIGMAYLRSELAEPGTDLEIDVRGRHRRARVGSKPLYKRD